MDIPNGSSIVGFYCRTMEATTNLNASASSPTKAGSSPTKKKQTVGKELKTVKDLGFTLWKWS